MENSEKKSGNKTGIEVKKGIKSFLHQKMELFCDKLEMSILKDNADKSGVVYGPVPSRRLGYSLGINNIKRKICTYDCIYCQAGKTTCCSEEKDCCLSPHELYFLVKQKIQSIKKENLHVDYISFVPNGEPTIDGNLDKEIKLLREFGYKIAVFTNSSLLWNDNVKARLINADYVSVKVDTLDEELWEKINRPHCRLRFDKIIQGIREFSNAFDGTLTTETMLIKGMNDNLKEIRATGEFLNNLKHDKAYFTIPIRPTAEPYATIPSKNTLMDLSNYIYANIRDAEMLCCPESGDFSIFDKIENDILGILSVHPMREEALKSMLEKKDLNRSIIDLLVERGDIKRVSYEETTFYSLADIKEQEV